MRKFWVPLLVAATSHAAQSGNDLFEKQIRPILVAKCFGCHSSKLKTPMGGLLLDTKAGLRKGGASGPVVVPGDAAASRLLLALSYTDTQLRMPPTGKLQPAEIAAFQQWIAAGAPDPREDAPAEAVAPKRGMDLETGRRWWAFQPLAQHPAPKVQDASWPRTAVDPFILAGLEAGRLQPSPPADSRTLIRRAYLDLIGLNPTFAEVESFVHDTSPDAYEKLIDRLLASPHYGERWGRHWLDVARYAEDSPSEGSNPSYPFAWRYRDWVIEAMNRDEPYDRFVKLQLAADLIPGTSRQDLRALGYLGAAPVVHKDPRLSKQVTETFYTDDWDERVDAVSRGLLGLTVACARCHDHKFDPITSRDYYGLAGVFASTFNVPRPTGDIDPQTEARFMWAAHRIFYLSYASRLLHNEVGTRPEEARAKSEACQDDVKRVLADMVFLKDQHPDWYAYLVLLGESKTVRESEGGHVVDRRSALPQNGNAPFMNAVFDAGVWLDASDPELTFLDLKPGMPRDLPVFLHGSVATPGPVVPRQFPAVLAKSDPTFHNGSGRAELAGKIFSDAAPLAARVIVNRVWGWHFGNPLVATPSDFGTQGEKPTHPELLDDLAARFVAHHWSIKWLHREIMLSAAYGQASRPRGDGVGADPTNRLLWRMNPRRLDIEAYRDSLLQSSGSLDEKVGGPSFNLDTQSSPRRTVYSRISRKNLSTLLRLYDFAEPVLHSPGREPATTPLQQLFVMNSQFMQDQAAALVKRVESEPDTAARIRALYRRVLARDPNPKELDLSQSFLAGAGIAELAQALLSTNEVIFWP